MSLITRFQESISKSLRQPGYEPEETRSSGFVISLCILASCVLWFAFSMQETYTQVIDFPTEVQNLTQNQALATQPPDVVRVQLEGKGIQILRLYYNTPTLPIEASNGLVDMGLTAPETINNVSIQTVTPRTIEIRVEDRISRKIPVMSRVEMQFAPGFRMIGAVDVFPDSVTISGARSIVMEMESWPTEARHLGEMRDSLNAVIALSDSLKGLIDLEFAEVNVVADIQAFTEARRNVGVRAIGLPLGMQVTFSPATVEAVYQVPLSQFDQAMEAEDFYVFVPYADILRDTQGRAFPMIHLPVGIDIQHARFEPDGLSYFHVRNDD